MAGGDFALIKAVEGFEDFTQFGAKQIESVLPSGVREGDVVFAITEGGETSFVIGTAWQGLRRARKPTSSTTILTRSSASTSSAAAR